MGGDGGPHVSAGEPFANGPSFVEDGDGTLGADLADEVHATSGDGQWRGPIPLLGRSQFGSGLGGPSSGRGLAVQLGRRIMGEIPLREVWGGAADLCQSFEATAIPESAIP